jgi:hypothetical protein
LLIPVDQLSVTHEPQNYDPWDLEILKEEFDRIECLSALEPCFVSSTVEQYSSCEYSDLGHDHWDSFSVGSNDRTPEISTGYRPCASEEANVAG